MSNATAYKSNRGRVGSFVCVFTLCDWVSFSVLLGCQPALMPCYFCTVITLLLKNQIKLLVIASIT